MGPASKVLIAAPFAPDRGGFHGGTQAIGRLIDDLADHHSVAVLYLRAPGEPAMEDALAKRCALVEEVPRHGKSLSRHLRLMGAWTRGYPMWVEDWHVPAYGKRLRHLVEHWQPDIVQFEFHTMAQYVDHLGDSPVAKIMVVHEPGAAAARDREEWTTGWRRFALSRDRQAWTRYERGRLAKFDAIVCFTERDRRDLLSLHPGTCIEVIAPRGPVPGTLAATPVDAKTIFFIGSFIHPPNVEAAVRLAHSIFPLIRQRHSEALLQLAGDSPPGRLLQYAGPGIEIPGRVPQVAPLMRAAAVFVAPIYSGGGIRIKMMDALGAGKAIVATPLACEGLDVRDGEELLQADNDAAFAEAVCTLLSKPAERQRLGANAREWAIQFAAPGRVSTAFGGLYQSVRKRPV